MTYSAQGDTPGDEEGATQSDGTICANIRVQATPGTCEGEIAALTTTMRQVGDGSQGGAEALAIFHQLVFDEWMARIKVGEKCFGMIEWNAVRISSNGILPSSQQWQIRSTARSPLWNRKEWNQCQKIEARNRDTWTAHLK